MSSRFIQIHYLTSYPAALLNRDDAGFAKRIPFGGTTRTRISSQCLKRHWRTFDGQHSLKDLDVPMSIRSRLSFDKYVFTPLKEEVDEALARAVTTSLMAGVLGKSAKAKKEDSADIRTGQVTVLGPAELDYLRETALQICKSEELASDTQASRDLLASGEAEKKKEKAKKDIASKADKAVKDHLGKLGKANLKAMGRGAGLDAAMFGRMVTSDILARGDAALHVAHAFTVHAEEAESDYFSAVDDLLKDSEDEGLGSGHIGSTELTSGLFYGYVVVDVPLLVANLEGCKAREWENADRELAGKVVESMVHLAATVSPGAKLGSTAPYSYAHLVLVETGESQPRTLANAFLRPVVARPDLLGNTYTSLAKYLKDLDGMYGGPQERRGTGVGLGDQGSQLAEVLGEGRIEKLAELAAWTSQQVRGG